MQIKLIRQAITIIKAAQCQPSAVKAEEQPDLSWRATPERRPPEKGQQAELITDDDKVSVRAFIHLAVHIGESQNDYFLQEEVCTNEA